MLTSFRHEQNPTQQTLFSFHNQRLSWALLLLVAPPVLGRTSGSCRPTSVTANSCWWHAAPCICRWPSHSGYELQIAHLSDEFIFASFRGDVWLYLLHCTIDIDHSVPMFVFPPQNFHPSCFEDYKNVSGFRIKALNQTSSASQTFDLLFVSTVVVHRSRAVAQQAAHRSSAEHLRQDGSGRHFFLRRLCNETGSGVRIACCEKRGGFNRCAIRANWSVTLLLPHFHLSVKKKCFYRAEDQSSATSTWIHFCIWILCDHFRWSVPELNLFKKRKGFVAFG